MSDMTWRKVSEVGLPEAGREVIAYIKDGDLNFAAGLFSGLMMGRILVEYDGSLYWFGCLTPADVDDAPAFCGVDRITHWMPMPDAPEEDA